MQQDLELIATLDGLGYDEAWVGDHSGGWETIACQAVHRRGGAHAPHPAGDGGHQPALPPPRFMVAQRMVLLDHLTRGRVMLGVGRGPW